MGREWRIYAVIVAVLVSIMVTGCSGQERSTAGLTSEQFTELRQQYPLATGYPALIDMVEVSFEDIMEHTDAVIIAEVIRQMPNYTVDLPFAPGAPETKLKEKQEAAGFGAVTSIECVSYQAKVQRVITGAKVADEINLFYNAEFQNIETPLKPGMKIVTAVMEGSGNQPEDSYSFTRYSTYYVVEGDYVLTAYEGETEKRQDFDLRTNGKTLENLIAEIRNLEKQRQAAGH
ncbi:hypothetical protein [Paenibacillus tepidiphilus]|uniref:hypothetical protein n=1 Tax=Paenibacillus tepidiphilus TaxID=2608683 RepID=UPI00123AA459|nr:hypothetical protein [Paenibacillus tepidiphilus]